MGAEYAPNRVHGGIPGLLDELSRATAIWRAGGARQERRLWAILARLTGGIVADTIDEQACRYASVKSEGRIGSFLIRRPVSENTAFATAGPTDGTPGSPTPPGASSLPTT